VGFSRTITTDDGTSPTQSAKESPAILDAVGSYTILPCDNAIDLDEPDLSVLSASNPEQLLATIKAGYGELASLIKPIFYQDHAHAFFIEPTIRERTIEDWREFVVRTPLPDPKLDEPERWHDVPIKPEIPRQTLPFPFDPKDPRWNPEIRAESLTKVKGEQDWLVNPDTKLVFEGQVIGPTGRTGMAVLPIAQADAAIADGAVAVQPLAGLDVGPGSSLVIGLEQPHEDGHTRSDGGMNLVGSSGFNLALSRNMQLTGRPNLRVDMLPRRFER
jgi:hypothetical protein